MTQRQRRLYLMTLLTELSGGLLVFAIARELAERGDAMLVTGLFGAAHAGLICLTCLFSGRLSDRLGRQPVMAAGMVCMLVSAVGCALLHGAAPGLLVLPYALSGVGLGITYPPLIAWLSRTRNGTRGRTGVSKALIHFCIAWNLGLIAAQGLGGAVFGVSHAWPALLAVGLAAVNLVVLFTTRAMSTASAAPEGEQPVLGPVPQAQARLFMKLAWLANLGGAFSGSMIFYILPNTMVEMHVPSDRHGLTIAAARVVTVATYLVLYNTRLWHHRFSTALASQAVAAVGLVVLATAGGLGQVFLGLALLAQLMGYNYFASLYYSTHEQGDERRGAFVGLHEASLTIGFAAGSLVGGIVGAAGGARVPYFTAAAVIAALACVQAVVYIRGTAALSAIGDVPPPPAEALEPT